MVFGGLAIHVGWKGVLGWATTQGAWIVTQRCAQNQIFP